MHNALTPSPFLFFLEACSYYLQVTITNHRHKMQRVRLSWDFSTRDVTCLIAHLCCLLLCQIFFDLGI